MTRQQYRRLLREARPESAKMLKEFVRVNGLNCLDTCTICNRSSDYAGVGFFIPTTRVSVRMMRWLLPVGAVSPVIAYVVCRTCHGAGRGPLDVEQVLFDEAAARMRAAGLEPPTATDDAPATENASPQHPEDVLARLHIAGRVQ